MLCASVSPDGILKQDELPQRAEIILVEVTLVKAFDGDRAELGNSPRGPGPHRRESRPTLCRVTPAGGIFQANFAGPERDAGRHGHTAAVPGTDLQHDHGGTNRKQDVRGKGVAVWI